MVNVASSTGVMLDPVYTGKAALGLVKELQNSSDTFKGKRILFLHTGNYNCTTSMPGSRGATGGLDHLKNHKNVVGFLSNTVPDSPKNHKTTKPAFNIGPLSACQQNAI